MFGSFGSLLNKLSASQLIPIEKVYLAGASGNPSAGSAASAAALPFLEAPESAVPALPVDAALVYGLLELALLTLIDSSMNLKVSPIEG